MPFIVYIRYIWAIYLLGIAAIVVISISRLIFSRLTLQEFTANLVTALIWPLTLFSSQGRGRLLEIFGQK